MIKFIEAKSPNLARIGELLKECEAENHWANQGPLYRRLSKAYSEHIALAQDRRVTPCANAGIALEAMARVLSQHAGRPLRWVVSAFSFQNLGRGYFSDVTFVDCKDNGLLDLDAVRSLPEDSFDGLIVVNPFGLFTDFSEYTTFAKEHGKRLLLDNAAGLNTTIPDWPWQSFSLHQTKPYGMGEGGLALTPTDVAEDVYALLNYGAIPKTPADWLNNGKLSDVSCAFHIDRLEAIGDWSPRYQEQAERVTEVAIGVGMTPIRPFGKTAPAMSWAYRTPKPVALEGLNKPTNRFVFGKYYRPLAPLPNALELYESLLNIPTHPDMSQVKSDELKVSLEEVLER